MKDFKHRQMLFDFHTSGDIENVGAQFDEESFGRHLEEVGVEKITIFSKCHHSWCYYPTKVGFMHPHLTRNLCGDMLRAAKKRGIKTVLYFTVGWSEGDAERHPEWVARNRDGSLSSSGVFDFSDAKPEDYRPPYLWKQLCINSGYREHCMAMIREIVQTFPDLDGLFLDIMFRYSCYCPKCMAEMRANGVDIDDSDAVRRFYNGKWLSFVEEAKQILFSHRPDAEIFFNGGADMNNAAWHDIHTHIEMEDLPTAWGGYDKMPLAAKYFHRKEKSYLGMTAKFHAAWGEFGGYKNREALRYEVAAMMAFGAGVCIGDQMHPLGFIEEETFRNVAYAFQYAQQIDEYCFDAEETSALGVVLTFIAEIDEGVSKVLLEAHLDFDIVLPGDDLSRFDTIILPERVFLDADEAARFNAFLRSGGKLFIVGRSGLDTEEKDFVLNLPLHYEGKSEYEMDFIQLEPGFAKELVHAPFLCYRPAYRISAGTNTKVLAWVYEPYFNRTMAQFCSHCVTPYRPEQSAYPAVIAGKNFVYVAHDAFSMYRTNGAQLHRDYLTQALGVLYQKPVLTVGLMSGGRTRLAWQPQNRRYVLHLLYGPPIVRGNCLVLEDFPEVRETPVTIRTDKSIARVVLRPQNVSLDFEKTNEGITFTISSFRMHQIITIEER